MTTMFTFLLLVASGIVMLGYWFVVGCMVLRAIRLYPQAQILSGNGYLLATLAISAGMLATITILFALGIIGVLTPLAVGVAGLMLLVLALLWVETGGH